MSRRLLGRDSEGRVVEIVVEGETGVIGGDGGAHPNLATHEALGLVTDADLTTHAATAHGTQAHAIGGASHTGSLTAADVGASVSGHNHDAAYSATGHTHPGGSEAFPVGSVFLAVVATNPGTLLGYGTWSAFGAGRMLVGLDAGQTEFDTVEETGGAKTHGHTSTQPADHAALTHAGATVGNHAVTQPSAHSDHAVLSHSAHAGATVADHAAHTHTFTQSSNATTPDLLTVNTAAAGVAASGTTGNPNATQTHTVGQANAHTDHAAQSHSAHAGTAVDAHSVGQANQHAAQSHTGAAVADGSTLPPYIVVHMWKRTA